jgi:hypothetical protein
VRWAFGGGSACSQCGKWYRVKDIRGEKIWLPVPLEAFDCPDGHEGRERWMDHDHKRHRRFCYDTRFYTSDFKGNIIV